MHERKLAPHAGVSVAGPKRKTLFFLALPRVWARCAYLSPHPPVCVKLALMAVSEICPVTVFFVHAFQKRPHGRPDGGGGKSQKKQAVFSRSARRGCYRGVWRMVGGHLKAYECDSVICADSTLWCSQLLSFKKFKKCEKGSFLKSTLFDSGAG